MILTRKQEEGLNLAIQRYKDKEKYTVIAGYAGAGKTTVIHFIVEALANLGIDPDCDVCFCSYTGKATLVLQQKGNDNAMTLHKLLYTSHPCPDGGFIHIPKKTLEYKVIIVDECSMMPKKMMDLLLKHPVYCIFCGDPMQLPPVDKNDDNQLLNQPHVFLDEIMRQAAESEIIQLSMAIRDGRPIKPFKGQDVIVMNQSDFSTGVMLWGDQILCATNKIRVNLNNIMRKFLGRGQEPESGDRLICLHNYDYVSESGNFLVNGVTGLIRNCYQNFVRIPGYIFSRRQPQDIVTLEGEFIADGGDNYGNLIMDYDSITKATRCLDTKALYRLGLNKKLNHLIPLEFTYGYAITVWKSQGSSWPKIVLLEESFPYDKNEHKRYLYTGLTRAETKAVLILKD